MNFSKNIVKSTWLNKKSFRSIGNMQEFHRNDKLIDVPMRVKRKSFVPTLSDYDIMYQDSIQNETKFWCDMAKEYLYWEKPFDERQVRKFNFDRRKGNVFVEWFKGGKTNICYNAVDRHVKDGFGDQVMFYWEGNEVGEEGSITYAEFLKEVQKMANVLKERGVKKGDRVTIYMPMIFQLHMACLACARIGAVHSVVFAGFSAKNLAARLLDAESKILLTADGFYRGKKFIPLKETCDAAIEICERSNFKVENCLVWDRSGFSHHSFQWNEERDENLTELMRKASDNCPIEWVDAEDPLFMLYTSGSTGTPKGVLHTTAGYALYCAVTFRYCFDFHPEEDVYFTTADVGWISAHSHGVYGPTLNRATQIIYEGIPVFPDASRWWSIIEKYGVTQFYTAPTALRTLQSFPDDLVLKHNLSSLRILGTVGEPIDENSWKWYYQVVGKKECSVVDTYWQTELGSFAIVNMPGATPMLPRSATKPFFGIKPAILNDEGKEICTPNEKGHLVFKTAHPGMMRGLWKNQERFEEVYFSTFNGYYQSGDLATCDENGYYTIQGRSDDVINISGHRIGSGEIESAITDHPDVVECAVISIPHKVKGESIYVFVIPEKSRDWTIEFQKDIKNHVRKSYGAIGVPQTLHYAPSLPKTRSGKIMRRILRKIATKDDSNFGDVSTLEDPSVIERLIEARPHN